jgi:hypothetical protein
MPVKELLKQPLVEDFVLFKRKNFLLRCGNNLCAF